MLTGQSYAIGLWRGGTICDSATRTPTCGSISWRSLSVWTRTCYPQSASCGRRFRGKVKRSDPIVPKQMSHIRSPKSTSRRVTEIVVQPQQNVQVSRAHQADPPSSNLFDKPGDGRGTGLSDASTLSLPDNLAA